MNYTFLIYQSPGDFTLRTDPEKKQEFWSGLQAYHKALVDAGVVIGGAGLQLPSAATTIMHRDGQRIVQDGPYADTKEQLGGIFIVTVPDLDAALDWAARCPCGPGGVIEVRPNLTGYA